jgi:hypothetical protein
VLRLHDVITREQMRAVKATFSFDPSMIAPHSVVKNPAKIKSLTIFRLDLLLS